MSQEEKTNSIPVFSKEEFIPSGSINEHDYVDLGLPSGLKWATCNIGASSPEGYGDYFSWGETNPKDSYEMDSYRFAEPGYYDEDCEESDDEEDDEEEDDDEEPDYYYMVSYNEDDGLKKLNPEDDAAVAKWNGTWRMPSMEDFRELIDNCEWTWGEYNGIAGVKVKGPNGSSIFLPAAGHMEEDILWDEEESGEYWSSSLEDDTYEFDDYWDFYCARTLSFEKSEPSCYHRFRELGDPVRPVCIIENDDAIKLKEANQKVDNEPTDDKIDEYITLRPAKKHIFQYEIHATVGQIIKDLRAIIEQNPESYLCFYDENGSDFYIKGTKEWNGLLILKTSGRRDDAIYVEDLLEELDGKNENTKVVLGSWWELRDITPEDNGPLVWYEEDYGNHIEVGEHDLRLFSAEDLSRLFENYAERYPDRRVVCLADDGKYYSVSTLFDDDFLSFICVKEGGDEVTASIFADKLKNFYWSQHGVAVKILLKGEEKWAAIGTGEGSVFFEDKVDGEDVIAFRLGETLIDRPYERYEDEDFWNDDDTVVTVDDLCDEEEKEVEVNSDEKIRASALKAIDEIKEQAESTDKGDMILKLVSYEGSVIKMMTALSSIDGIDEEEAFAKLQRLPAVILEGVSAKKAMQVGAMLEEAGATVSLENADKQSKRDAEDQKEEEKGEHWRDEMATIEKSLDGKLEWRPLGGIFYAFLPDTEDDYSLYIKGETFMPVYDIDWDEIIRSVYPKKELLNTNWVENIIFLGGVKSIYLYGFGRLSQISLPPTVERIENSGFECCFDLETVVSEAPIKEIGRRAFWGCKQLRSINISKETKIGDSAFWNCKSLPLKVKELILQINPKAFD